MQLSARNQLPGTVTAVKEGAVGVGADDCILVGLEIGQRDLSGVAVAAGEDQLGRAALHPGLLQ